MSEIMADGRGIACLPDQAGFVPTIDGCLRRGRSTGALFQKRTIYLSICNANYSFVQFHGFQVLFHQLKINEIKPTTSVIANGVKPILPEAGNLSLTCNPASPRQGAVLSYRKHQKSMKSALHRKRYSHLSWLQERTIGVCLEYLSNINMKHIESLLNSLSLNSRIS